MMGEIKFQIDATEANIYEDPQKTADYLFMLVFDAWTDQLDQQCSKVIITHFQHDALKLAMNEGSGPFILDESGSTMFDIPVEAV